MNPRRHDGGKSLSGMSRWTKPQSSSRRISHRGHAVSIISSNIPHARAGISSPTLRASSNTFMHDAAFQFFNAWCTLFCFIIPHVVRNLEAARFIHGHLRTIIPNPWFVSSMMDSWRRNRFSCERPRTNRQRHCMQRRNHENIQHWTIKPHPYGLHRNRHSEWHAIIRSVGMLTASHANMPHWIWWTIHDAGIKLFRHEANVFRQRHAPSICILLPYLWFPMIPRHHPHRGHPYFLLAMRTVSCPSDWYSRFARLTGIMRKYMPGFVRRDMRRVSPSPVSCAIGHIENSSHNTIHDFPLTKFCHSAIYF